MGLIENKRRLAIEAAIEKHLDVANALIAFLDASAGNPDDEDDGLLEGYLSAGTEGFVPCSHSHDGEA